MTQTVGFQRNPGAKMFTEAELSWFDRVWSGGMAARDISRQLHIAGHEYTTDQVTWLARRRGLNRPQAWTGVLDFESLARASLGRDHRLDDNPVVKRATKYRNPNGYSMIGEGKARGVTQGCAPR